MIDKDAIDILKSIQNGLEETRFLERCAIDRAIEALEERPHITDEQISDAFQLAIVNYWESKSKYLTPPPSPCCDFQKMGEKKMEHKGEWIIVDDCEKFIAKCSVCGRIEDSRLVKNYPFCRCGADMRKKEGGKRDS